LYIERGQDARTTIILRFPLIQSSCASAYRIENYKQSFSPLAGILLMATAQAETLTGQVL